MYLKNVETRHPRLQGFYLAFIIKPVLSDNRIVDCHNNIVTDIDFVNTD